MSSKSRKPGGKEKWVSGKDFKFETPQKIPKRTRQHRHLSIPSPWMHKLNTQVKPGQVFAVSKTPIKKSSTHVMKKRSERKKVRIFVEDEIKGKRSTRTPKIKKASVPLVAINFKEEDMKYTEIKNKALIDSGDEMDFSGNDSMLHNDSLNSSKKSKTRSSKARVNGSADNSSPRKRSKKDAQKVKNQMDEVIDEDIMENLSEAMTNGDHDILSDRPNKNLSKVEVKPEKETIMDELAKLDMNVDPEKMSTIPEGKSARSWCSIA